VKNIEEIGGISMLFLTHRDDVADHDQWTKHFGASRVMHAEDAGKLKDVIEQLITGKQDVTLRSDLLAIPTPGHTRGHMVLLYRERFLFTGDHLWWSPIRHRLIASKSVSWYSWPEQLKSVGRLLGYSFEWVLPGHGRRLNAPQQVIYSQLREIIRNA
jgi:glyoxylase-like metal-dependent hydrolase (beta-lactamase superfamily II)